MEDQTVCRFCSQKKAPYTCPRCNLPYCSLSCYKSDQHLTCSESFYRDCVMEDLECSENTKEEKQKMLEILKRFQEDVRDDDSEEEPAIDLMDRVAGLDLNKDLDKVWRNLTADERREFEQQASDGKLTEDMDLQEPWWCLCAKAVQDLDEQQRLPQPVKVDIPPITTLLRGIEPASTVMYDLINVIFGYGYVVRLHNCDIHDLPVGCCFELLGISSALSAQRFNNVQEAVEAPICFARDLRNGVYVSESIFEVVANDVLKIVKGRGSSGFLIASLSDIWYLLRSARKILGKDEQQQWSPDEMKKQQKHVYSAWKKIEFFLSYVEKHYLKVQEILPELHLKILEVEAYVKEVEDDMCNADELRMTMQDTKSDSNGEKKLVEII